VPSVDALSTTTTAAAPAAGKDGQRPAKLTNTITVAMTTVTKVRPRGQASLPDSEALLASRVAWPAALPTAGAAKLKAPASAGADGKVGFISGLSVARARLLAMASAGSCRQAQAMRHLPPEFADTMAPCSDAAIAEDSVGNLRYKIRTDCQWLIG